MSELHIARAHCWKCISTCVMIYIFDGQNQFFFFFFQFIKTVGQYFFCVKVFILQPGKLKQGSLPNHYLTRPLARHRHNIKLNKEHKEM